MTRLTFWTMAAFILFFMTGCDRAPQLSDFPVGEPGPETGSAGDNAAGKNGVDNLFTVALLPEEPIAGDALRAIVSDGRGPFEFLWEKNGERFAGRDKILPPLGLVRGDVVRVVVTARGEEAIAETVIRNSPPRITEVVVKTPFLRRGTELEVESRAIDADGDLVEFRYTWLVNDMKLLGEEGPVLSGDSFARGDIVKLVVIPVDGEEEGEPFSQGLEFEVHNAPPRFVSTPPSSFSSAEYRYQVQADDPDGDEISLKLAAGPEGMSIDPVSGLLLWAIPTDASGNYEVKIEAQDAEESIVWQEFALQIERGE